MPKTGSIVRILFRIGAGLSLCLVTAELVLRLAIGLGNPVLITPDFEAGYILKPNQDVVRFFCRSRIDRNGMRSDPFNGTPAPDTLRILFVGDSITYGTTRVDQKDIFTEILHRNLAKVVHKPVEILNASAGGWAIDNEVSYVHSRGIFGAQKVVLVLNSGDAGQPRSRIEGVGDDLPSVLPASALEELWSRFLAQRLHLKATKVDSGDVSLDDSQQIRANLNELEELLKLVSSHGAELAIVYIPFRKDIPTPNAKFDGLLQTWANAHRVPFIDTTSTLTAHAPNEVCLRDNTHLNKLGHQLVAQEIERQWPAKIGTDQ
jgi:lysophospholipase L1-like esterase